MLPHLLGTRRRNRTISKQGCGGILAINRYLWGGAMKEGYVADFSLALINRTGAYHICRDLVQGLPEQFPHIRYWRLCRKREPNGIVRKILGKAMLAELGSMARSTSKRRHFFREPSKQAT